MGPVFLNVDGGEQDDEPAALYALAQLVNVACGGHAGDAASMGRVVDACKLHGTKVGAHPSYPDRANFGRAAMVMDEKALFATVRDQCAWLAKEAKARGAEVGFAKPHGALYHAANKDQLVARATLGGIVDALGDVTIVGPPAGFLSQAARALGLTFAREDFADRGVQLDGSLVPRGQPGALIGDSAVAAARAQSMLARVDTICVHGDTPNAVAIARAVRGIIDAQAG